MRKEELVEKDKFLPLNSLLEGESGIIHALRGGRMMVRRLIDLGFIPGEKIRVLRNHGYGPVLVALRGSHLGIGRGMSQKIMVSLENA